jgi:ABC-type bacteriocin/lantibiotic exporter with double-glycine peptidase domain
MVITRTPSARMVAQQEQNSCGVACVRQLLQDWGIHATEVDVRAASGTAAGSLTTCEELERALNTLLSKYNRTERFKGAGIAKPDEHWQRLLNRAPFCALLGNPGHWVIVDQQDDGDVVYLRDPAPAADGSNAGFDVKIGAREFTDRWLNGGYTAVYRLMR